MNLNTMILLSSNDRAKCGQATTRGAMPRVMSLTESSKHSIATPKDQPNNNNMENQSFYVKRETASIVFSDKIQTNQLSCQIGNASKEVCGRHVEPLLRDQSETAGVSSNK
jgi:hypothetical protein